MWNMEQQQQQQQHSGHVKDFLNPFIVTSEASRLLKLDQEIHENV